MALPHTFYFYFFAFLGLWPHAERASLPEPKQQVPFPVQPAFNTKFFQIISHQKLCQTERINKVERSRVWVHISSPIVESFLLVVVVYALESCKWSAHPFGFFWDIFGQKGWGLNFQENELQCGFLGQHPPPPKDCHRNHHQEYAQALLAVVLWTDMDTTVQKSLKPYVPVLIFGQVGPPHTVQTLTDRAPPSPRVGQIHAKPLQRKRNCEK